MVKDVLFDEQDNVYLFGESIAVQETSVASKNPNDQFGSTNMLSHQTSLSLNLDDIIVSKLGKDRKLVYMIHIHRKQKGIMQGSSYLPMVNDGNVFVCYADNEKSLDRKEDEGPRLHFPDLNGILCLATMDAAGGVTKKMACDFRKAPRIFCVSEFARTGSHNFFTRMGSNPYFDQARNFQLAKVVIQ